MLMPEEVPDRELIDAMGKMLAGEADFVIGMRDHETGEDKFFHLGSESTILGLSIMLKDGVELMSGMGNEFYEDDED
jgi:hypothetical protein